MTLLRAQWLNGRVLDSRPKGRVFEPHQRHCVVSLSKSINPSLVLVQPWKTHIFITERFLMACKESDQTNKIMTLLNQTGFSTSTKINDLSVSTVSFYFNLIIAITITNETFYKLFLVKKNPFSSLETVFSVLFLPLSKPVLFLSLYCCYQ